MHGLYPGFTPNGPCGGCDPTAWCWVLRALPPAGRLLVLRRGRMPVVRLTARNVVTLPPPQEGRTDYRDDILTNFFLRVSPTGARSFGVTYFRNGRLKRYTIGSIVPLSSGCSRNREEAPGRCRKRSGSTDRAHRGADPPSTDGDLLSSLRSLPEAERGKAPADDSRRLVADRSCRNRPCPRVPSTRRHHSLGDP
jgi:hypothetical protein